MPNVTFKFVITETPLPADQDGRQQIIASISDDNAKRIMDLTGLAGEVEALKAHCHRMLNLARNRFLGYCDHNRSTLAIMEECRVMGMDPESPKPAADSADVLTMLAEMTLDRDRLDGRVAELERHLTGERDCSEQRRIERDQYCARVAELERALAESAALVQTTSLHEQAARAEMQKALAELEQTKAKARMHDDARAMLDTLGIAKRSDTGGEFTVQHRIGLLNDDAEREKGAAQHAPVAADKPAPAGEIAAPVNGDYVLATKYEDGEAWDWWGLGWLDRIDNGRFMVVDSDGKQTRGNGYRRCRKISRECGNWLWAQREELERNGAKLWDLVASFGNKQSADQSAPVIQPATIRGDGKRVHKLKTWPIFYEEVRINRKQYELRKRDRDFQVGDYLELVEWDPATKEHTGRSSMREVTYMMTDFAGLVEGNCLMSIAPITADQPAGDDAAVEAADKHMAAAMCIEIVDLRAKLAEAQTKHKRADDWCGEVMGRLCKAAGVDLADLDEPSVEDMERAIADAIADERTASDRRVESARADAVAMNVRLLGERDAAWKENEKVRTECDKALERVAELERERDAYTYKSGQATNCAVCGKHKHTPLRRDHMGGYVCLTCIDKELDDLRAKLSAHELAAQQNAQCATDEQTRLAARVAELERGSFHSAWKQSLADIVQRTAERDKALDDLAAARSALDQAAAGANKVIDQLKADIDALRTELAAVSDAIGTCSFMDPPDGGSPTLAEQVRRMRKVLDESDAVGKSNYEALKMAQANLHCERLRVATWHDDATRLAAERDALKATVASLVEHAPPGHPLHSCGGPQEACMQPGCTECGCPTMEQALALRKDATRWRGLIASQRIRPMGCAGLGDDKENDPYAHLGLEIWTIHPGEHDNRIGIDWLTKYADKAAKAAGVEVA